MSKKNTLYPDYFHSFNCIASKCKNTCCGGWGINIDKQTLKKYKNSNHPILKENRKDKFKQTPNGTTVMKLDKNLMCPFLDEDKLCTIHKNLGDSFLCTTCKIYPRVIKEIDETIELSLSASCEAAAKVILSNKDGLSFQTGQQNIEITTNNQISNGGTLIQNNFWSIRVFIIEALQYRELSIEERLAIIGLFINRLEDAETENQIESLIEQYSSQLHSGSYKGMFNSLNNYNDLLKIQTHILNSIQLHLHQSKAYKHLTLELNKNLFSNQFEIESYLNAYELLYKKFIFDKIHIIENYLVNVFFNTSNIPENIIDLKNIFTGLVIRSGLIKNIITNALILEKDLSTDEVYDLISILSRIIDHSKELDSIIPKTLKENNFDSTSNLLALTV